MYKHCDTFDVFEPIQGLGVSLARVVEVAFGISARGCARSGRGGRGGGGWARVCCFLPRNTNLRQLAELVPEGVVWHVERDYVNERLKGISVYAYQRVGSGGS